MGLGLLGRGVGDAKFLAEQGAELIVTDLKDEQALAESLAELAPYKDITYRLGGHDLADFKERDFILKAAGVPLNSPYIAEARKNGIPVKMSASWFAEIARIPLVGVTGTRGKSTTTHLIYEIMKASGMDVLLGGNVQGVSTLAFLPRVTDESIALMELDSWQCQGFGEAKLSPNISVFTTFMPDHLNYYRNMDAYLEDKAQIFLHQKPEDTLIAGEEVTALLKEKYGRRIVSHLITATASKFPKGWTPSIPGAHNKLNAQCAIEAARVLGIDEEIIKRAVENFTSVPGRLEFVRELRGVRIYNDTTATTPEATIAALEALDPEGKKNIILIAGGMDKGLDISKLPRAIEAHAKEVFYLSGTGTARLPGVSRTYDAIAPALKGAIATAAKGDILLFSPAFTSFGMFKNEFDRGRQFTELLETL